MCLATCVRMSTYRKQKPSAPPYWCSHLGTTAMRQRYVRLSHSSGCAHLSAAVDFPATRAKRASLRRSLSPSAPPQSPPLHRPPRVRPSRWRVETASSGAPRHRIAAPCSRCRQIPGSSSDNRSKRDPSTSDSSASCTVSQESDSRGGRLDGSIAGATGSCSLIVVKGRASLRNS